MPPDDDFLDHPEHMRDGAVDDETAELLPLFPDGVADDRWDGVIFPEPPCGP